MSVKEEIIKKVIIMENPKEQRENDADNDKNKFLGRLKRKYRLMIIFVFFLLLILIFMISPMIIAIILQNL